jgi:hypothetical protein
LAKGKAAKKALGRRSKSAGPDVERASTHTKARPDVEPRSPGSSSDDDPHDPKYKPDEAGDDDDDKDESDEEKAGVKTKKEKTAKQKRKSKQGKSGGSDGASVAVAGAKEEGKRDRAKLPPVGANRGAPRYGRVSEWREPKQCPYWNDPEVLCKS